MKPLSPRPWRNAVTKPAHRASGEPLLRKPITGFGGCCPRKASGQIVTPPSRNINSRRFSVSKCTGYHCPGTGSARIANRRPAGQRFTAMQDFAGPSVGSGAEVPSGGGVECVRYAPLNGPYLKRLRRRSRARSRPYRLARVPCVRSC
jgi:hypothetical protein